MIVSESLGRERPNKCACSCVARVFKQKHMLQISRIVKRAKEQWATVMAAMTATIDDDGKQKRHIIDLLTLDTIKWNSCFNSN